MDENTPRTGGQRRRDGNGPFWRRRWVIITAGLLLLLLSIGVLSGDPEQEADDRAARGGATATPTPSPTPDPAVEARTEAASLVSNEDYLGAIDVLEDAGLASAAGRVRGRGTRALLTRARRALNRTRYEVAKAYALEARQLARTSAVRSVLVVANEGIARERAEARERRQQARIARDLRTCTGSEKDTVRAGAGIPAGCTTYAVELETKRAAREAEEQAEAAEESADAGCAPGYSPCIPPHPPDLDCADVGPVTVTGSDPHGLDADDDGVGCGGD